MVLNLVQVLSIRRSDLDATQPSERGWLKHHDRPSITKIKR